MGRWESDGTMAIIIGSEEGKDEKYKHPSYKMEEEGNI